MDGMESEDVIGIAVLCIGFIMLVIGIGLINDQFQLLLNNQSINSETSIIGPAVLIIGIIVFIAGIAIIARDSF